MANCPRCLAIIDDGSAYCGGCGRPRIVDSLRNPVVRTTWRLPWVPIQQALLGALVVWLLITLGVAFLRELKVVRDSELLIQDNHFNEAWAQLKPFVAEHPDHAKGAFLCGRATIRLDLDDKAKACLTAASTASPQLAKELSDDFRGVLTARTRALGCSAQAFGYVLAKAEKLGAPFIPAVVGGLDQVLDSCRAGQGDRQAWLIGSILMKQHLADDLAASVYAAATGRALAQARYRDARMLALQGERVVPAHAANFEALLDGERRRVQVTVATLRGLCESLKVDPRYRSAASWCFPASAPPAVQTARDGWGKPVHYGPLAAAGSESCRPGFILVSFGAAKTQVQDGQQTPASGISCRLFPGANESWQLPERFWLPLESH